LSSSQVRETSAEIIVNFRSELSLGGTKGIGRGIVEGFLAEGSTVHFCSRTSDEVIKAQADLRKQYPQAEAHGSVLDVGDRDAVKSWVEKCVSISSKIDVVVANVSALALGNNIEQWDETYRVDILSTVILIQTALPELEMSKGNIIAINSVSGRDIDHTAPGPYGSMKAALIHYIASLARTLAPKAVRANTVSPGNIYVADGVWGRVEKAKPEKFKRQLALNPMGRMGNREEVANAVVFLASEKASFISGTNLVVDGALCTGVQF